MLGLQGSRTRSVRNRQDAEKSAHDIYLRYGEILERNKHNYKRRIFLESLHSSIDENSVNEKMEFPRLPMVSFL